MSAITQAQLMAMHLGRGTAAPTAHRSSQSRRRLAAAILGAAWYIAAALFIAYLAVGTRVYWDVAEQVAKADSEAGANKELGKTAKAASDDDALVRVRLTQ